MITKQNVANYILAYLQHKISLNQLVSWAEDVILNQELDNGSESTLMEILGNLGLSDVKTFGLTWEDCETMMKKLGYQVKVEASLAS